MQHCFAFAALTDQYACNQHESLRGATNSARLGSINPAEAAASVAAAQAQYLHFRYKRALAVCESKQEAHNQKQRRQQLVCGNTINTGSPIRAETDWATPRTIVAVGLCLFLPLPDCFSVPLRLFAVL